MTSQQRGHRRQQSRSVTRPTVLVAAFAAALLVALACVTIVTERAAASARAASAASTLNDALVGKVTRSAAPSPAPPTPAAPAAPAGPAPSASSQVAELPPPNPATPTPSPTPSPTPTPTPTATDTPTDDTGATDRSAAAALNTTATAAAGPETDRVGALFSGSATNGNHFCTASVVQSPTRNLLVTAAHCVSSANGVLFAPAYRNGQTPYGVWQVTQVFSTTGWKQSKDPDQDFALLEVAPLNGRQIQDVVGGNPLGLDASFNATVRIYGYANTANTPILCSNTTTQQSAYQRRIDCPAYPGGTSGGPWINSSTGDLIGIIGGYQQGGNSPDTSYSAYFDSTIGNLFQLAVAQSG